MHLYDYVVENDEVDKAVDRIKAITSEHLKRERIEMISSFIRIRRNVGENKCYIKLDVLKSKVNSKYMLSFISK